MPLYGIAHSVFFPQAQQSLFPINFSQPATMKINLAVNALIWPRDRRLLADITSTVSRVRVTLAMKLLMTEHGVHDAIA